MNVRSQGARLFISTARYPFGRGEQFLDNEMPYLSAAFDYIEVQPTFSADSIRDVPQNVIVHKPLTASRLDKFRQVVAGALAPVTWLRVIRLLKKARSSYGSLHLHSMCQIVIRSCLRRRLEVSQWARNAIAYGGPRVAYAYWGADPADAAGHLAKHGVRTVVRFHRYDLYVDRFAPNGRKLADEFHPWHDEYDVRFHKMAFISEHGLRYFQNRWANGRQSSKFVVSRLGTRDSGSTRPRTDSNKIIVASCSRISPVKRVHLIAKLAIAIAKSQQVEWHHFGSGVSAELADVLSASTDGGFRVYLHGYVPNDDVRRFYRENHVDLFVNLSLSEGIPVSIMEAISADIPVLATSVDGNPEAVVEGVSGLLCSAEQATDSEALAVRVLAMLESRKAGALQPRALWSSRFNAQSNYQQFCTCLLDAAS